MATWQGSGTGNWSNSLNWLFFTPPNSNTDASIGTGNATVDTFGLEALNVFLFGNRTVDAGFGGSLAVSNIFNIAFGSSLVVRNGGSVSASRYDVSGKLVVGGAGVAEAGGSVTGAVNLLSGGLLSFNTTNAFTFSNSIGGAGSVEQKGTGTSTLSGANTYTGVTTVIAGVLAISNASALGTTAGNTTVAANAALQISGGISVGEALTLNGTGIGNTGALRSISGDNTWNGAITLGSDARINVDSGNFFLAGGMTGTNKNLILGITSYLSLDSAITIGSGSLTKNGAGTARLNGANPYTGVTTVNEGTLQISGGAAIAETGAVVVNAPGRLQILNSETIGSLAGGGTVAVLLGGTLTTGGNNASTTFSGVISGDFFAAKLTKVGTGTFTLSGANTYGGSTTVAAGTLTAANASALGNTAGSTTVSSGATLALQSGIVTPEAITLSGTGVGNGGALRNLDGAVVDGAITLAGATRINSDSFFLTLNGGISGAQNLTFGGAGTIRIGTNGINTGTGTLTKDGEGYLQLFGTNTYTGLTTVSAGSLRVEGGKAIADTSGVSLAGDAIFGLVGSDETIGFLSGTGGTVQLTAGRRLTINGDGDAIAETFTSGAVSNGTGGLTKTGTDTQGLTGVHGYQGATIISGGTLALSGTGSIASSSELQFATSAATTFDISAVAAINAVVQDVAFNPGSNGTIVLGGKTLNVTHANGDFGIGTLRGLAGQVDKLTVNMDGAATSISIAGLALSNWADGIDTITLFGNGLANSITGNSGANILIGGVDLLVDTLTGGAGGDTFVLGTSLNDVVVEAAGAGGGIDTITSEISRSLVGFANVENLILFGTTPISGTGNELANFITGNLGDNLLTGLLGNDTLVGGQGKDTLNGGAGKDLFTGGGGLDRFIFSALGDTGTTFATRDVINTFAHGDKIDLSAIDARTNLADDQAFTFIGAAAFSGAAGQLRFDMNNISPTGVKAYLVQGDVNGDRVADFTLQIFTAPTVDRPGQLQVFDIFAFDFIL